MFISYYILNAPIYIIQDFSKWVICRVFEHSCDNNDDGDDDDDGIELSCLDEVFLSLDDFDDVSFPN